jgi:hypothetical protein
MTSCAPCPTCYGTFCNRHAAANQPFILVPNANHAQTSNGVVQVDRGDMTARIDHAAATEVFAKAIAAFLTTHEAVDQSFRSDATDRCLTGSARHTWC